MGHSCTRAIAFSSLGLSLIALGCGSGDNTRRPVVEDGGATGGVTATGGMKATGGVKATGGTGGAPATGGTSGASTGGTRATGGRPQEAGVDASRDASIDGSPDTAVEASTEAGPLTCRTVDGGKDAGVQWLDYAANSCRACPAATPACSDLLGPPGPVFDPKTRIITLHLGDGVDQIESAEFTGNYEATNADGGPNLFGELDVEAKVDKNTITVDLSKTVPAGVYHIDEGTLLMKDACGQSIDTSDSCFILGFISNELTDAGAWTGDCFSNCL